MTIENSHRQSAEIADSQYAKSRKSMASIITLTDGNRKPEPSTRLRYKTAKHELRVRAENYKK
ncbi:hypothetical protein J4G07_09655 [Candidatus Poribacteria bacterium]|nr:hypothetical protein [Candidatus Poribacteria bacterium]